MNPFEGVWINLQCGGSPDIESLLKDAKLIIDEAQQVFWQFGELEPLSASVQSVGFDKLRGRFPIVEEPQEPLYYYEVVARSPPESITAKRCLYGIVCKIDRRDGGGEDLGDTGTWKAEEQHPEG